MSISRTASQIKKDMLEWAKTHLETRAADEWGYDMIDADPLVNLMIDACASEAKSVYDSILETDDRIQERILRYLIPEAFQIPLPAIAVAKILPTVKQLILDKTTELKLYLDKELYYFSPIFDTTLLDASIRYIAFNERIIDTQSKSIDSLPDCRLSKLFLVIESKYKLDNLNDVQLYFDFAGATAENQVLLSGLKNSKWYFNGNAVNYSFGFADYSPSLSELFSSDSHLIEKVKTRFSSNFYTINDKEVNFENRANPSSFFLQWLKNFGISTFNFSANTDKLPVYYNFLQIDLPYPVTLTNPTKNFISGINYFPIANRKLIKKSDHETYFSNSFGVEIIPLQPDQGRFCGIHSVVDLKTGNEIQPEMISKLFKKDSSEIKYSLRYAGTGRLDNLNTWQRLSYMLSVFRKEQMEQKSIENLGLKLSLEEIHEVLGRRITKELNLDWVEGASIPVYLIVNLARNKKLDSEIKYWTTVGESANNISIGTKLYIIPAMPGVDAENIFLVTPTNGGKLTITSSEQNRKIQDTLFRKERISTVNDIKSLCRSKLGDQLIDIQIKPIFEPILDSDQAGIKRAFAINLTVHNPEDQNCILIKNEIQWNLEEKTMGIVSYKVILN